MSHRRSLLVVVLTLALGPSSAVGAPILFSVAGADAASITPTVNDFRTAVGGINNMNAAGPLAGGRREINWDGGGGVSATAPAGTPFNGFQNTRGALFTTPGTGFLQATPAGLDTFFGRVDGLYDSIFDAFSPLRVFTPIFSTITDTTFSVPGSSGATPASVSAFGVIFSDVDSANVTSLQFFDLASMSLGTFFVPAFTGNNTFSFLGVLFNAGEQVGRVRITSGNQLLNTTNTATDQVVMDDFIFAEPQGLQSVPEPASLALLGIGAVGLASWRRKQRAT